MHPVIENLNWRYATKKFDATKKISISDLEILKEAVRLSASSYGLQPYRVVVVENEDLRAKLQGAAFNQTQITEASAVFVFANILDLQSSEVVKYIENIAATRTTPTSKLKGFEDMMNRLIVNLPVEAKGIWSEKQTYIALGTLLSAAADLKIDATPMEGFNAEAVNEILNLNEKGLSATLIVTLGYRHEEDAYQHLKKVRKSNEELFITL